MNKTQKVGAGAVRRMGQLSRMSLLGAVVLVAACSGNSADSLIESANKHLQNNDSKAAIIELKNALQKDPRSAEARFLLGRLLLESGDPVGAGVELDKAQELGYPEVKLIPMQAKLLLARRQGDKLLERYGQRHLGEPAAEAELQALLASAYLEQGKRGEAQAALDAALKAGPGNVDARLLNVRMLASAKDIKGASEALEQLIAAAPNNSEARKLKGDLLLFSGNADGALAAYNEAIEKDKKNLSAHDAALWLTIGRKDAAANDKQLKVLQAALPQHPLTKFFTALVALEKGDTKTAEDYAQQLLKQAPDNVRALQLAGSIALQKKDLVLAQTHLVKALQIAPDQVALRLQLARAYLGANEPAKVMKTLQPLVTESGNQWEAFAMMGQASLISGDVAKAETYLSQAVKLNPKDGRSRSVLAVLDISKGRNAQGMNELRSIASTDTGPTAELAMIGVYLKSKNYDQAMKVVEDLEHKLPKLPLAANMRGQIELQRGRRDEARAAFEAALKLDPANFPASTSLALMDIADNKPAQAQQRYEKLLTVDPNNGRAVAAVAEMRLRQGANKEELVEYVSKAIRANPSDPILRVSLVGLQMSRNEVKLALAAATEGLAAIPGNPELLDMQGLLQMRGNEASQAIVTYGKLAAVQPNSPQAYMRLAEIGMAQKDAAMAAQNFRKALGVKPDLVLAQRGLIAIEVNAGRSKEALAIAKTMQSQHANAAAGYMAEGDIYVGLNRWPDAVAAYKLALSKESQAATAIKLHGALFKAGKTDEAQKLAQDWLRQNPKDTLFPYYQGDLALAAGKYDLAQQQYEAVLRISPDNAAALNNVAWLLNRAHKPEALDFAQRATKLAPGNPSFMDTLAEIYAGRGDTAKAIEIQKAVVKTAPDMHEHRLHLARYYLAAGDKTGAREELDKLAALGSGFRGQAEVQSLKAKL